MLSQRDPSDPGNRRRATRVVLILGALLVVVAATGVLRADRSVSVDQAEALAIAETRIDFEPERTNVRLVRRGFGGAPFWAVSFSIPAAEGGFERLTTVLVDGRSGEIVEINVEEP